MAQVSEIMFTFQPGKTQNTFTPNRSLESVKPKQANFKDDLTAARNVNRDDDNNYDSRPPLQKTQRNSERVNRAAQKLNKKVGQKPQDEKEGKKPVKFNKKIEDDMNELLNLLNNIAATQPNGDAAAQTRNAETLEAVKELADAVKNQNFNLTGDVKKDISKLLDLLKEFAGKVQDAGNVQATTADINQQVKELVDNILQAQQPASGEKTGEKAAADDEGGIVFEKAATKEQKPEAQILYKLNKLNYELKNLTKSEGQEQSSVENAGAVNATEAVNDGLNASKENEVDETVKAAEASEEAVKPEEKAAVDSTKQIQTKNNAASESEEKLQKVSDKKEAAKEAVKEAREENSEQKASEKQEIKKAPEIEKTENKKVALDSRETGSTVYKNEQIQNDRPFEKVFAAMKTERTANVNKADVINQIVKKAEVTIGDKQSEMRMQLEPENLGKLTLKVTVERGIVTAKFVAESQQVKEIIETNFNQLKDALQEKGINVQSFSVSVGQDNSNSGNAAENYKQMWQDNIRTNGRINSTTSGNYVESAADYAAKPVNPYSYHDGKVDFRA